MNTHQGHGLVGPMAVARKNKRPFKGGTSDDKILGIRNPASYGHLEFWLFANMTVDELESARDDFCVPASFMTGAEAVSLFDRFFVEVREAFHSHRADEDFIRMDEESFSEYAQRALRYAFHDIIGSTVHDDIGDLGDFLSRYQPVAVHQPTQIGCQPDSFNLDKGEA